MFSPLATLTKEWPLDWLREPLNEIWCLADERQTLFAESCLLSYTGKVEATIFEGVVYMIVRISFVAAILLLAMASLSQSARANPIYWWPFAPPSALVYDTPTSLYEPLGYYRCGGGCCRRPVWRAGHWHSALICPRSYAVK
jgi:hypothetical protein